MLKAQIFILTLFLGCILGCSSDDSVDESGAADNGKVAVETEGGPSDAVPEQYKGMALIPAGTFQMGSEKGFPHEGPVHEVTLDAFYMDAREVTNAQFAEFVEATGYVTEAEVWKWSLDFAPDDREGMRVPNAEWWLKVDGVTWKTPRGPGSSIEGQESYPVIQVSWKDASEYAKWAGKRLPTEAEWEYAARGELDQNEYPWGNKMKPEGKHHMNHWQGRFPVTHSPTDGHEGLAPVGEYSPNGYGLYDMAGNVWEWCSDWYGERYYSESPAKNPQGPAQGDEKVQRGGSFLCAGNYCVGYRVSHRNKTATDSGLPHAGFRCVISADAKPH
jgi:formylglycine-generating enzyme required for sulfatase activity